MKKKAVSKRRKGVVTTRRVNPWVAKWRFAWKSFTRNGWKFLAGVGLVTMVVLIVRWL